MERKQIGKIKVEKIPGIRSKVLPRCLNAERACRLVGKNYLTTEECKVFELMGMGIEILQSKEKEECHV